MLMSFTPSGIVVFKTSFGLRLRAVGENPSAVETAGISVYAMRYKALVINGVLVAFLRIFFVLRNVE